MKVLRLSLFCFLLSYQAVFSFDLIQDSIPVDLREIFQKKLERVSNNDKSIGKLDDSLIQWLVNAGFLDTHVSTADDKKIIILGVRYILKEIEIKNKGSFIPKNGKEERGNYYFTSENLEKLIEKILSDYYDDGYFYARARVLDVRREMFEVMVKIDILKGPLVSVGSLDFRGLNRTSHILLSHYIRIKPGDSLTKRMLEEAERDASEIRFVSFRSPIEINPRAGYTSSDLVMNFSEKKRLKFSGGIGYLPESGNKFVWDIDVLIRNIFGNGKSVSLKSEHRDAKRDILDLSYSQPLFLIGIGEFTFDVATRDYRDEFYEFGIDLGFQTSLKRKTMTGLNLSWRRVDPSDNQLDKRSYSAYMVTVIAGRSWFDNNNHGIGGGDISMSLGYINRQFSNQKGTDKRQETSLLTNPSNVLNETKSKISVNYIKPLKGRLSGFLHGEYQGLETSDKLPPLAEMIILGGPGTIRGYANERFIAQRAAMFSVESRFHYESGYLFLFYDGAYMNRPIVVNALILTDELYRDGYGFGLSIYDSLRHLKVSLGWNRESGFNQPRLSVEFSSDL